MAGAAPSCRRTSSLAAAADEMRMGAIAMLVAQDRPMLGGRMAAGTASVGEPEAGAAHILQRPLVLAPLVVGGEDRPVGELHDARIADVLVDARVGQSIEPLPYLPLQGLIRDEPGARPRSCPGRRPRG